MKNFLIKQIELLNNIASKKNVGPEVLSAINFKLKQKINNIGDDTDAMSLMARNKAADKGLLSIIIQKSNNNEDVLYLVVNNPAIDIFILSSVVDMTDNKFILGSIVQNSNVNYHILYKIAHKTKDMLLLEEIENYPLADDKIKKMIKIKKNILTAW